MVINALVGAVSNRTYRVGYWEKGTKYVRGDYRRHCWVNL